MHKKERCYTLIVAPATSSRFYKLVFHHWQFGALAVGCLLGLSLFAGLFIDDLHVRREHEALQKAHRVVVKDLESRLASVEAQSHQVRQMAEGLGLMLDEALVTETDPATSGVGGPSKLDSLASDLKRVASSLKLLKKNLGSETARLAATPLGWPTPGPVTSGYGPRRNPFGGGVELHTGVDIGAGCGRPVHATAEGMVIYAGARGGYGNLVVIDHGGGIRTLYAHLSSINVSVGDGVKRGDQIGRVGRTGRATAAHVHYEIRVKDHPVDPRRFAIFQAWKRR